MMRLLLFVVLMASPLSRDLQLLHEELNASSEYDARYEQHIDSLRHVIEAGDTAFATCMQLFDAYASYKFDSAYHYVQLLEREAETADLDSQVMADIKCSFAYFSAGLFKEAHDILSQVKDVDRCSRKVQAQYYSYYARLFFDLGSYADGSFMAEYQQRGQEMLSKQLALLTPKDTTDYFFGMALQAMKNLHYEDALYYFKQCLECTTMTDHEKAIAYSTMAYPARELGDKDAALHYMIMAAICDLRSSTKEGVALRQVATMLHERGYSEEALELITRAKEDADFYGARHRQMEVNQILPIIEHEQFRLERRLRNVIIVCLAITMVWGLVMVFLMLYLRRKLRALSEAHESIHTMNQRLSELGKLKEEYIGSYLSWQSDMVRGVDSVHTHLLKLTRSRDLNGLVAYIDALPQQNRRQEFMDRFDRMFLNICPNFVENFNNLLLPEYRIHPKEGELLTTELRIFALIRLGITTNEKIAQVLDYSVNTVYTYKTKMRNRSSLSSDDFYAAAAKC